MISYYVCIIHVYMYIHIHTQIHRYIDTYIDTHIHTYIHTLQNTYTIVCVYIYIYIYACVCACVFNHRLVSSQQPTHSIDSGRPPRPADLGALARRTRAEAAWRRSAAVPFISICLTDSMCVHVNHINILICIHKYRLARSAACGASGGSKSPSPKGASEKGDTEKRLLLSHLKQMVVQICFGSPSPIGESEKGNPTRT